MNIFAQLGNGSNCGPNSLADLPCVTAEAGSIQKGLAVVFGVAAAIAVLVIITAAIDFSNSGGDPEKIARGRSTIIYALIGLTIALSAEIMIYAFLGRV